jgi:hypothetical protein
MWYVFVAELSPEPRNHTDVTIYGGFVGGQYASQDDALAVYDWARSHLKLGETIYPPFEADDPLAARQHIRSLYEPAVAQSDEANETDVVA